MYLLADFKLIKTDKVASNDTPAFISRLLHFQIINQWVEINIELFKGDNNKQDSAIESI